MKKRPPRKESRLRPPMPKPERQSRLVRVLPPSSPVWGVGLATGVPLVDPSRPLKIPAASGVVVGRGVKVAWGWRTGVAVKVAVCTT